MRVLLTNLTLATRTGTEVVTRDLAVGLVRAGHRVCVFSPSLGPLGDEIAAAGIPVVSRLEDVPFRPDIIHGHHHVETTLALLHFRNVPAIFVCHDRLSWHDTPPRLEGIRRYVAVDRNCLERLVIEAAIPEEHTRLILNAVDLRRFAAPRRLPGKPERALVFSNYVVDGADLDTLRQACRESGLELAVAGGGVAAPTSRPEEVLAGYDLVFAKARCALEALAAGCAVIVCDRQGLGPMITRAQFEELREWNFGARCLQQSLNKDAVCREIDRYDPADARSVTGLVRTGASLEAAVAEYERVYGEALASPTTHCVLLGDAVETLARKVGWLESLLRKAREPFAMPPLPRALAAHVRLRLLDAPKWMAADAPAELSVEIENRSAETLATVPPYPVHLSYHWLEPGTRRPIVVEGARTALAAPVRARSQHRQPMQVTAPAAPGRYLLMLTLVQERQFWFDRVSRPVAAEREIAVYSKGDIRAHQRLLSEVAAWTSARVVRDGSFANLGFVSDPLDRMLAFVEAPQFAASAVACPRISCVLTGPDLIGIFPETIGLAVAADPKRSFFEIHNRLASETDFYGADFPSEIHASARLHPRCWVDEKNVIVHAGVTVGPNASVLGRSVLGEGAVIQAGAVVGASGFQSSQRRGDPVEMLHAGTAEIGPACQVFANAVIARGLFRQPTRLDRGCRIGNGAFVSHNCVLGREVFVGHGAVVNGNVSVGAHAWIGPGATIVHGIRIGEAAQVSLGATVVRDVEPGKRVTGSLAIDHRKMLRLMASAEKPRSR